MKIIFAIVALFASINISLAQQVLSAKDMVGITPIVCDGVDLPKDAKKSLDMKLLQMVTLNGMGSFSGRFALTPNVVFLDKQVTATVPAKYIVEMEVSIYLLDVIEQVVLDEKSFVIKGVGQHENKAIIQAINNIGPRTPQNRMFIDGCRSKIIDYYTTRVPTLVKKADMFMQQEKYDEAMATLVDIPENIDQYELVADRMVVIYKKKLDVEAQSLITEAKAAITLKKYEEALGSLTSVHPSSSYSKTAESMMESIKKRIDEEEKAAIEREIQKYEDAKAERSKAMDNAHEIRKIEIEAQKVMSVETAKAVQSVSDSVSKWFFGRFKF